MSLSRRYIETRSDTWFGGLVRFMDDPILCSVYLCVVYIPVCVRVNMGARGNWDTALIWVMGS